MQLWTILVEEQCNFFGYSFAYSTNEISIYTWNVPFSSLPNLISPCLPRTNLFLLDAKDSSFLVKCQCLLLSYVIWKLLIHMCSIDYVKVRGRPLSPAFGVQNIELSGDFVLEYKREFL